MDEPTRARLRDEALQRRAGAAESQSKIPIIERGSVSGGFGRYCWARSGPALHDVHRNGSIPRLITAHTGAIVAPTGAYYNYYRAGDFTSVHADSYGDELVLLSSRSSPCTATCTSWTPL